ncbi:hypothetical protein E1I69_20610 [Bacillus timonensis]|uniref:Permease n=1 Tax=Bacillus timonensis TaxID=1033734 RepID=A0A4S3PKE2_9BACI|nr:hypothetical protein [Bacillus timonensis]THE09921.1 hypothetical protein E1I69_20610 [Bacillus timonensis]
MSNIIVIILVVPMISWVFEHENYIKSIIIYFSRFLKTSTRLYLGIMTITQLISCFLLIASIPVTYHFISDFLNSKYKEAWEYLKSTAILRAFGLITFWSISLPSFAYGVEVLHADLSLTLLNGFLLSFCGILISVFIFHFINNKDNIHLNNEITINLTNDLPSNSIVKKTINEFIVLLISLLGSIVIFYFLLPLSLLIILPLVAIIWTITFFLVKKDIRAFISKLSFFMKKEIPLKAKEVVVFFTAGFVVASLNHTDFDEAIVEVMYQFSEKVSWMNFLFIIPFTLAFLGFIGMPPVASMVLVVGVLQGITLPYPAHLVVLSLATGSLLSILNSPFTTPGLLLSSVNGLSSFKNTFKRNWLFTLIFFTFAQLYIQFLWMTF